MIIAVYPCGMKTQNQIKRKLSEPSSINYICDLLENQEIIHRSQLSAIVCEHFGFYDTRDQAQNSGCIKALRELEAADHFVLPPALTSAKPKSPRRLSEPVPLPEEVPDQAGEIMGLKLELVSEIGQKRIWNELMITEHPQGAGPFVGRQLRYLIDSHHGWLGG